MTKNTFSTTHVICPDCDRSEKGNKFMKYTFPGTQLIVGTLIADLICENCKEDYTVEICRVAGQITFETY